MEKSLEKLTWNANPGTICKSCAFLKVCPAKNTSAAIPGSNESDEVLQKLNLEKRDRNKTNNQNNGMEMLPFGEEN
jgi:hypothetical protein